MDTTATEKPVEETLLLTEDSKPQLIERFFTQELNGEHPEKATTWIKKIVEIDGQNVAVEVPDHWSERSALIAAKHYLSAKDNMSVKRMLRRVYSTITKWGIADGVFETESEAQVFEEELAYVLINRLGTFNSPVWYNLGVEDAPLLNACFLNTVEDSSESITDLATKEVNIFKWGAGTGCNWSKLRSSKEKVRGGGNASGPVSFMIANDVEASKWKSGGKHRRAARLDRLDIDHPDIKEFIEVKRHYENMARALIKAGWSTDMNDPKSTSNTVPMQSTNTSVGLSDQFMHAVENDSDWPLILPTTGEVTEVVKARDLMHLIAECAHDCGDPGVQFHDTINKWSFISDIEPIETSNPCQWAKATVLTPKGIRQFKDIEVGSTIWSGKRWTKVTNKTYSGRKTVYAYYTTAGTFYGTENHHIISNGKRIPVKDAETIDACCAEYQKTKEKLNPQDIIDGLVVGDGSVHNTSRDPIVLYIGANDTRYDIGDLLPFIKGRRHRTQWRVKTTLIPDEMPKLPKRKVPARFRKGTPLKVRGFLRGIYSANGSICGNRVTLKASSFKIIEAVQEMLSSIGIHSYYTTNHAHDVKFKNGVYRCKKSYDLNITKDRKKFKNLIGFIQEAKTQWLRDACKTPKRAWSKTTYEIKGKKNLGEHPVWDITVDAPEHTYWTGGLLVSNCSEVFNANNVSCNLANMNLLPNNERILTEDEIINISRLFTTALDTMLDHGRYPAPIIEETTKAYRPLGIGWCNLGAAVLSQGWAYDSRESRRWASYVTSLTTAAACLQSMEIAKRRGPFSKAEQCTGSTSHVLRMHLEHAPENTTRALWHVVCEKFNGGHLLRNSALTCAMPTGTTGLLLDAETTGPEPLVMLRTMKKLSYGGEMELVAHCVLLGLKKLGYQNAKEISEKMLEANSAVGLIKEEHLPVFDTAFNDANGRCVSINGHLKMLAAMQPHISMGLSKTCNLSRACTIEDIEQTYITAWKLGLKSLAIYRDGSKAIQVYSSNEEDETAPEEATYAWGDRKPLPHTRAGLIHKFDLDGTEVYLNAGMYEDGRLGEIWITANKHGATITGLLDSFAIAVSMALQHGAPLEHLSDKFRGMKFAPAGFCEGAFYTSLVDYVFRWLEENFPEGVRAPTNGELPPASTSWMDSSSTPSLELSGDLSEREPCPNCGEFMVPNGVCQMCPACGSNYGGCG